MPVYTAPATLPTGFFVTASVYNTELVENIKYFKDKPVFDTAVIIGAETTSGIRLDLESGTLAVREGDDSAYAPLIASIVNLPSGGSINFASGDVTITHSTNTLTFGGAASGYIFNDGNVGIGVTPSAWLSTMTAWQMKNRTAIYETSTGTVGFGNNLFVNSSGNFVYLANGAGALYDTAAGEHRWYTAPSGTAGNTATLTERFRILSSGIAIGATARIYLDGVAGTGDTYIEEGSANNLSIYVGGSRYLQMTASQFYVQSSDLLIAPTRKFYLDGGGDTYISEPSANTMDFYVGGNHRVRILDQALASYGTTGIGFYASNGGTNTGTTVVRNGTDGYLYLTTSSRRFKENISPAAVTDAQLDAFMATAPSWWDYKGQKNGALGFIAEDLAALPLDRYGANPLVNYGGDGQVESNRDYALIAMHHLVIQRLERKIAALEARIH